MSMIFKENKNNCKRTSVILSHGFLIHTQANLNFLYIRQFTHIEEVLKFEY